jgi:hypothetical protein
MFLALTQDLGEIKVISIVIDQFIASQLDALSNIVFLVPVRVL